MSYDIEKLIAEQRATAERFMRDLEDISRSDEIGMWFAPPGLETMHWFRCGARHGDGSMPPHVARLYHKHKAMGAQDVPPGVEMRPPLGFERDGKLGVYLWYHPDTWSNIQNVRRRMAQRKPSTADLLQRDLGPGVELTVQKGYDKPKRGSR
jgi:hypothetical protein